MQTYCHLATETMQCCRLMYAAYVITTKVQTEALDAMMRVFLGRFLLFTMSTRIALALKSRIAGTKMAIRKLKNDINLIHPISIYILLRLLPYCRKIVPICGENRKATELTVEFLFRKS